MTQPYWAVICPENSAPGVWRTWLREHCVAVSWPPPRYNTRGKTNNKGWALARKRLRCIAVGHVVIPYLTDNRFGTPGVVRRLASSDAEWNPTVQRGLYKRRPDEAALGRRIYVDWMTKGMPPIGRVAVVPIRMRQKYGEVHQAIEPLKPKRFARFMRIIRDPRNWKPYFKAREERDSARKPDKIHMDRGRNRRSTAHNLDGNSPYLERAREAFPLLVRQARARESIFYSDLADELGMPNPRNLNYVLSAIGKAIKKLSAEWKQEIPPLQCVVVNKSTGLPGEGVKWFITDLKNLRSQTAEERSRILRIELTKVFSYPKWEKVLGAFGLEPIKINPAVETLMADARAMGGVGEGQDHRKLKQYIADNPKLIGLKNFEKGNTEYSFPSADRIDIVFLRRDRWVGVEVKGPCSPDADLMRGLFQAVKYAALREAELKSKAENGKTEVILVMSRKLPDSLIETKNLLGVTVLDQVTVPPDLP